MYLRTMSDVSSHIPMSPSVEVPVEILYYIVADTVFFPDQQLWLVPIPKVITLRWFPSLVDSGDSQGLSISPWMPVSNMDMSAAEKRHTT